jgi:hypothetical protein
MRGRNFPDIPAKWLRLFPAKMIWLQSSGTPNVTTTIQWLINKHRFLKTK